MIRFAEPVPGLLTASQDYALQCDLASRRGEAALRSSSHPALRRLSCECYEGVLTIHGRVPTYYLKQVAQSLLGKLEGVEVINNQVEVRYAEGRPRQ